MIRRPPRSTLSSSSAASDVYKRQYQWNEAMQYSKKRVKVQGICPNGWHIPSSNEIDTLIKTVNKNGKTLTAGFGGTNITGFSDMDGAIRVEYNGKAYFESINIEFGRFWNSTDKDVKHSVYFCLQRGGDIGDLPVGIARQGVTDKNEGLPIRCLKD